MPSNSNADAEVEAMRFFENVVDDNDEFGETRERILENEYGERLTVEIVEVDRKALLDDINKLPDEMLRVLMQADDPDEAEEEAREENMLSGVSGATIEAFESICAKGIEHPKYTSDMYRPLVEEFDLEVLFPIGAEVMELSFDKGGSITDFHEPESDKNSS